MSISGEMLILPPGWLRLLRTSPAGRTSPANPASSAGAAATEAALLLHWQRLTPRAAAASASAAATVTCPPLPLLDVPAAGCGGGVDHSAWAVRRLRPPTQLAAFLALSATVSRLSREGAEATAEAEAEAAVEAGAGVEAEAEAGALAGGGEEGGVSGPLLLLQAVTASLAAEWTPPGVRPALTLALTPPPPPTLTLTTDPNPTPLTTRGLTPHRL